MGFLLPFPASSCLSYPTCLQEEWQASLTGRALAGDGCSHLFRSWLEPSPTGPRSILPAPMPVPVQLPLLTHCHPLPAQSGLAPAKHILMDPWNMHPFTNAAFSVLTLEMNCTPLPSEQTTRVTPDSGAHILLKCSPANLAAGLNVITAVKFIRPLDTFSSVGPTIALPASFVMLISTSVSQHIPLQVQQT